MLAQWCHKGQGRVSETQLRFELWETIMCLMWKALTVLDGQVGELCIYWEWNRDYKLQVLSGSASSSRERGERNFSCYWSTLSINIHAEYVRNQFDPTSMSSTVMDVNSGYTLNVLTCLSRFISLWWRTKTPTGTATLVPCQLSVTLISTTADPL